MSTETTKEPIVKNAVTCGICQSPADRYDYGFQCQANPNHMGDLIVGIFSDLTPPDTKTDCTTNHFDIETGATCPRCGVIVHRDGSGKEIDAPEAAGPPKRYWMTTPVHPEKIVDWFLALHHYWFDESLGPNAFTGMRDLAEKYLTVWVETGELAPDKTTLEIYVAMKFQEWINSSWSLTAPVASQSRIAELEAALKPFAELLDPDSLDQIGGGTLVAPEIKVQMVKDARAALFPESEAS